MAEKRAVEWLVAMWAVLPLRARAGERFTALMDPCRYLWNQLLDLLGDVVERQQSLVIVAARVDDPGVPGRKAERGEQGESQGDRPSGGFHEPAPSKEAPRERP